MPYTLRPGADEYGDFYAGYVSRVPDGDLVALLEGEIQETLRLVRSAGEARGDFAYAPGKWTLKEVVGHLVDTERVMSYRAFRVSRGDRTPLPGFDQDEYVAAARFGRRSLAELAHELEVLREASVTLFRGLDPEEWERRGSASGHPVSVRALACILLGHERLHRETIRTRYVAE